MPGYVCVNRSTRPPPTPCAAFWTIMRSMPGMESYARAARGPLRDKPLFASAHSLDHARDTLDFYAGMPLTDAVRLRLMYANAATLLGLAP